MSPPRMAALSTLYARMSGRTRALARAVAGTSFFAKLGIVATAFAVAHGFVGAATAIGIAVGALLALQRVASASATVSIECDMYRAATRAVLEGDVLAAPRSSAVRTIFDAGSHARVLLTHTAPELAANGAAAVVIAPLVVAAVPARLLALSAGALAVVVAGVLLVRRSLSRLQVEANAAQDDVAARTLAAVEGRLDLVAAGRDEAFARAVDASTARYRMVADRAAWRSALLGRAPLAAAAAAVAVVVVLDDASRAAVTTAVLANALVLGACLPVVLGLVFGATELVRAAPRVAPLLELLAAPRRREVSGGGVGIELPAPVRIDRLTFGYDQDAAPVCRDVSVEWPESSALVLEGPNGSGKSTLLRLLLGLRAPSEGTIEIGGVGVERLDAAAFRRAVGYLPQQPYLGEPTGTVRDAVRLLEPDAADEAIVAALDAVGLTPMLKGRAEEPLDVAVGELSSGQRQRLALGRALLRDASMYLLDEPDANLDRAGAALVATVIGDLVRRGKMVAIAAHTTELAQVTERRVRLP